MKAGYGISAFLLIALWLVFSLAAGVGKDVAFYIGVPWYLLMLPFIYLVMGIYGMFRARERMTYRDMYAGYYRIKYVKWILLILQAVSAAGDIFFMIAYHDCISMGKEIGWFAGVIGCLLCTVCMMVIHRRYPPYQIP